MNTLIKKCWNDYLSLSGMNCVLKDAIPILWFGDLEAYCKSSVRIITVGLNPSNLEFQDKPCDPIDVSLRFKPAKVLIGKSSLTPTDLNTYKAAMNSYFKDNPYVNWFKWHESALRQLNASYGGKMSNINLGYIKKGIFTNTAIHVDVEAPIPTNPTWGNLCQNCQKTIRKQYNNCFKTLITLLKPHVIIIASNEGIVKQSFGISKNSFNGNLSYNKHDKNHLSLPPTDASHTASYIRTFTTKPNYIIIWAKNYNGTPFGGMKIDEHCKITTLKTINTYILNNIKNIKLLNP